MTRTIVQSQRESTSTSSTTRHRLSPRERREAWEAMLFLSPWIIGFVLFTGGPVLFSLALSFFKWDAIHPAKFYGLRNYAQMLHDPLLTKSLWNTVVYAAMYIPGSIIMALTLAMLLNQKLRGMRVFRTIFYLPYLTAGVATYTLWAAVFEPKMGVMNRFLRLFFDNPPTWLQDPAWSKVALVIMAVWSVGGMMLVFLAGLQNISDQLYEAAEIDGAGPVSRFLNVTIPLLSPTIFFNTIITTIASFRVFDAAMVMTAGGPSNSTLFYVYHLFNKAFTFGQFGYASAMAWLLFAIVLVLTVVQIRLGRKWVHYG
jgi:multiple sugar transport system permease protein